MLCGSKAMIDAAWQAGYAVPASNVENLEMVKAVGEMCREMRSPVIMQTTPSTVRTVGLAYLAANVRAAAELYDIPIALHLDHGDSFELAAQALRAGYTSIMYDGSALPLEENIRNTKAVVQMARAVGVPVEAELGKVGGKEDDKAVKEGDEALASPEGAKALVEQTGIDFLAPAIGTAHGLYKGEPKIDFERLAAIRKMVGVPMVLHGGTGIPGDMVKRSISLGISKANFATELRIAETQAVRAALRDESVIDPKVFMKAAIAAIKEAVAAKILLCGSENKA